MNPSPVLAALAGALVLFSAQATASIAATQADRRVPIAIDACKADFMNVGKATPKTDTIEIGFRDLALVKARSVDFVVSWSRSDVQEIHDVGTFAPGVSVRHTFMRPDRSGNSPFFPHPAVTCGVESASFSDGSVWRAAGRNKA